VFEPRQSMPGAPSRLNAKDRVLRLWCGECMRRRCAGIGRATPRPSAWRPWGGHSVAAAVDDGDLQGHTVPARSVR
jgi:hypothetical protein